MTKEEILNAYEKELERIGKENEKALKSAKELCLKQLRMVRTREAGVRGVKDV